MNAPLKHSTLIPAVALTDTAGTVLNALRILVTLAIQETLATQVILVILVSLHLVMTTRVMT